MAITTLSMLLTVFVLNLHHIGNRPVPAWILNLVLVYVARVVGGYQRRVHVVGSKSAGVSLMLHNLNARKHDRTDSRNQQESEIEYNPSEIGDVDVIENQLEDIIEDDDFNDDSDFSGTNNILIIILVTYINYFILHICNLNMFIIYIFYQACFTYDKI